MSDILRLLIFLSFISEFVVVIYYRGRRHGCRLLRCGIKDVPSAQQRIFVTFHP